MKKTLLSILILTCGMAFGQGGTTSSDLYPAVTGQNIGNPSQRWNIYSQNFDLNGTPITGDGSGITLSGNLSAKTIEGIYQADQWSTANNGIANALAACSPSSVCQIFAPPPYPQTEVLWGFGSGVEYGNVKPTGPKSTDAFGCATDWRYSPLIENCNNGLSVDNNASGRFPGTSPSFFQNITKFGTNTFSHAPSGLFVGSYAYKGGRDFNGDESTMQALNIGVSNHTPTGTYGIIQSFDSVSPNDAIFEMFNGQSVGSALQQNEGQEIRWRFAERPSIYQGTISTLDCSSNQTCALSATQTQGASIDVGEGLPFIDLTNGYNTGYVAARTTSTVTISSSGNIDAVFGTTTGNTTTTAAVNNATFGSANVNAFPHTNVILSVASTTGFTTGKACILDAADPEFQSVYINAVGASTLTIGYTGYPISSGSQVTQGGLACYGFGSDLDWVGPGNLNGFGTIGDFPPLYTIRVIVPIASNAAGGIITVYNQVSTTGLSNSRMYPSMGGSGGTVTLTVVAGAVTACAIGSGGSGYISTARPPQVTISGTWTTAPAVHISGVSSGAITACTIDTPGTGISGTLTATVVTSNPYHIYPMARATQVYNASTGQLDGSAMVTLPTMGTFNVGDTIEMDHYFRYKQHGLNSGQDNWQLGGLSQSLFFLRGGSFTTNDFWGLFTNENDPTAYQNYPLAQQWIAGRGQLGTPYGFSFVGPVRNGLVLQLPPFGGNGNDKMGAVFVSCGTSTQCAAWGNYPVIGMGNNANSATGVDIYGYNPTTETHTWTAGATGKNGANSPCTETLSPAGTTLLGTGCLTTQDANGNFSTPASVNTVGGTLGAYQNQILQSQFGSGIGTTWAHYCTNWSSFTSNTGDTTDPFGGSHAGKFVAPVLSGTACPSASGIWQVASGSDGQTVTGSVWLKGAVGGESACVIVGSKAGLGNVGETCYTLTTSWQHLYASGVWFTPASDTMNIGWFTSTSGATIYTAQAQFEIGVGTPGPCVVTAGSTASAVNGLIQNCGVLKTDGSGNLTAATLTLTSSGTTVTTAGTAVAAGTCQAQTPATITGVTTGSVVPWSIPTALPATWQTGITVVPVVTANTVTLNLCNPTAGSITPAAQAVNVRVIQ